MCKKLGITALVVVGALFLMSKLDLLGYVKTMARKAKEETKQSIPPELKIERLKDELSRLPAETQKYRSAIASEIVEINKLKGQITLAEKNLQDREKNIADLRESLKNANATFVSIGGDKLPRDKVEANLTRKWDSFKQAKSAVEAQKEVLAAREESLEAAKQRLTVVESKRDEIEAKIAQHETELKKLRALQTKNNALNDNSQLDKITQLLDEVDTQIAKEKTELELQKAAFTDAAVDEALARKTRTDKAMKEMEDHFTGDGRVVVEKQK